MLTDSPNKKLSLTKLSNAAGNQMHLDLNPLVHLYLTQRPRHDLCKLHSGLEKNNCTAQPRFINVVKPRVPKSHFRSPKLDALHLKIVYQLSSSSAVCLNNHAIYRPKHKADANSLELTLRGKFEPSWPRRSVGRDTNRELSRKLRIMPSAQTRDGLDAEDPQQNCASITHKTGFGEEEGCA